MDVTLNCLDRETVKAQKKVEAILDGWQAGRDLLELKGMNGTRCANRQNFYLQHRYVPEFAKGGKNARGRSKKKHQEGTGHVEDCVKQG